MNRKRLMIEEKLKTAKKLKPTNRPPGLALSI